MIYFGSFLYSAYVQNVNAKCWFHYCLRLEKILLIKLLLFLILLFLSKVWWKNIFCYLTYYHSSLFSIGQRSSFRKERSLLVMLDLFQAIGKWLIPKKENRILSSKYKWWLVIKVKLNFWFFIFFSY